MSQTPHIVEILMVLFLTNLFHLSCEEVISNASQSVTWNNNKKQETRLMNTDACLFLCGDEQLHQLLNICKIKPTKARR